LVEDVAFGPRAPEFVDGRIEVAFHDDGFVVGVFLDVGFVKTGHDDVFKFDARDYKGIDYGWRTGDIRVESSVMRHRMVANIGNRSIAQNYFLSSSWHRYFVPVAKEAP
jgi:hypothetical protein